MINTRPEAVGCVLTPLYTSSDHHLTHGSSRRVASLRFQARNEISDRRSCGTYQSTLLYDQQLCMASYHTRRSEFRLESV